MMQLLKFLVIDKECNILEKFLFMSEIIPMIGDGITRYGTEYIIKNRVFNIADDSLEMDSINFCVEKVEIKC